MKNTILILLLSSLISCTKNDKALEHILHDQNKQLSGFYAESFYKQYQRISELLRPKDSIKFQEMKTLDQKIVWFDSIYPKLSKSEKLQNILLERKRLKNLNQSLTFLNLNLIKSFDDSIFDSSIKQDFIKAYANSIWKFRQDHNYGEVCVLSIPTESKMKQPH